MCCKLELVSKDSQQATEKDHNWRKFMTTANTMIKKKRPSFLCCKLQDEDRENIAELQDHQKI